MNFNMHWSLGRSLLQSATVFNSINLGILTVKTPGLNSRTIINDRKLWVIRKCERENSRYAERTLNDFPIFRAWLWIIPCPKTVLFWQASKQALLLQWWKKRLYLFSSLFIPFYFLFFVFCIRKSPSCRSVSTLHGNWKFHAWKVH